MPIEKLIAPSGAQIVGFLAKDGSIRPFEYRRSDAGDSFVYVIDGEHWGTDLEVDGDMVLLDDQGKTWSAKDVRDSCSPRT